MTVLVTGAGGTLASALARVGADQPVEMIAAARQDLDIGQQDSIERALNKFRPDVLINTAAYNAVDQSEHESERARLLNTTAVGFLAQACAVGRIVFVHYSTDYVFDGSTPEGYREDDHPNPLSTYGRSKWEGEKALLVVQGLKYYLIRTSRIFGPQGTSSGSKPSFVQQMIRRLTDGEQLSIIDVEESSPTYSDDLARATFAMIQEQLPWGIYHRTNDGSCTWYGFATEVAQCLRSHGKVIPDVVKVDPGSLQRKAQRPAYSVLKTTKLPPLRSWKVALREYIGEY